MSNITEEKSFEQLQGELEREVDMLKFSELPTANIMVAGKTGTGKSTLLNAIFGEDLAVTGTGKPVTDHIDEYQKSDIPIHIWDTVGLELDPQKSEESIHDIETTIANKSSSQDKFDRMHAIWYCIASDSNRYEGEELKFIRRLYSIGVPFIIVLTKCFGAKSQIIQFENVIKEENEKNGMGDIGIVRVLANDFLFELDEDTVVTKPAFGLEDLVNTTMEKLPQFIKSGFAAAQQVSQKQKREICEDIIFEYVDAAQKGFWQKVPIVNLFTSDHDVKCMFQRIGKLYNTDISDEALERIMKNLGGKIGHIDIEHGFSALFNPFNKKYNQKLDELFKKKNEEGAKEDYTELQNKQRAARLIAFYGYTFLDAVEELWQKNMKSALKDIDTMVGTLTELIKKRLDFSKK